MDTIPYHTLLDIFPVPVKSMNHKYVFVNKYPYDDENPTKNRSGTKTVYLAPKTCLC